ncbi:hypothetical protein D4F18_23760 [Salmonella enterica subsp. enterica serovar Emek]|nr:hypothetical protein [Salmonella enterica subsp. enterica serovar Emek]
MRCLEADRLKRGGDAEGCRPWLAPGTSKLHLSGVPVATVPAQGLAVFVAVVHETVAACLPDRAWSAIVEPCARVGSHGADERLALVDAVPDLPAIADADQERRDERWGAVDSPACVGSDGGFAFAVPAGDAQARTGLIGGDQAVVFPAATGAELTGVCRGGQWCVRGLFGTDPKREASGAPVALEVGVFNRAIEVALLINLSACLDPEGASAGAGDEQNAGELLGEFFSRAYAFKCCRVRLRRFVRVVIVVHCSPCVEMVARQRQQWLCVFFSISQKTPLWR